MILRNGLAASLAQPRPCSLPSILKTRSLLLQDPFFNRDFRPEELRPRIRGARIMLVEFALLLAKVFGVLAGVGRGSEEEAGKERMEVRNAALDQPFFDRERVGDGNPFLEEEVDDDEGYSV